MQGKGTNARGPVLTTVGRRPRMTAKRRGNRRGISSQGQFGWSGPPGDGEPTPTAPCTPERSGDTTANSDSDASSAPAAALGPADGIDDDEPAEQDAHSFAPGHPWHYLGRGDNAKPPPASQVPPNPAAKSAVERDLPRQPAKRIVAARSLLERDQTKLGDTIREYEAVVERGADALSQYDREIAYRGDLEMARAGTIAILYNQIAWWRGRVQALERETDRGTSRRR
jgi:hypothetical protein